MTARTMFQQWLGGVPPHIEVCLRVSLASFCGYALSVANIPGAVPPSLSFMVGLLAAVISMSVPCLLFGIGAACPTFITSFLLALAGSSILLCAQTVSSGCFVGIFAVLCLWVCTLRHGPDRDRTDSYGRIGIVFAGFVALSFRDLVQNGFLFTITEPPEGGEPKFELWNSVLSSLCKSSGQAADCWVQQLPSASEGVQEVVVPNHVDMFGGQTAFLSTQSDSSLTVYIPGGLWIVAGLWTWSGLDNPLANNRNFLIVVCWGLACVGVAILTPPVRTARNALTGAVIPKALNEISALLANAESDVVKQQDEDDGDANQGDDTGNVDDDGAVVTGDSQREQVNSTTNKANSEGDEGRLGRLIHFANVFAGGKIAALTAYEPRICASPFECSWPVLMNLLEHIERAIFGSIGVDTLRLKDVSEENAAAIAKVRHLYDCCAKALLENEDPAENLDALKTFGEEGLVGFNEDDTFDTTQRFVNHGQRTLVATISWLNTLRHPKSPLPFSKAGMQNVKGTYALWFMPTFWVIKGLVNGVMLPFRPKAWDLKGFLFSFKWTVGFVIMVSMAALWTEYAEFAIDVDGAGVGALYHGWSLVAYGFCWSPTVEGTVKLSLLRLMGTCLGAFSAWLGLIICAGSYNSDAAINPYGIVAWLTGTTALVTYFSIDRGLAAHLGVKPSYGKAGMYFALTQAIIALQTEAGVGTRDDLVANRVFSNACGCILAGLIALIPPHFKGNDPKLVQDLLTESKYSLRQCLCLLLNNDERNTSSDIDEERAHFRERKALKTKLALYLIKDASSLKQLPIFKVDPRLMAEIEQLAGMTGAMVLHLFSFASYIAKKDSLKSSFSHGSQRYEEVKVIIDKLQNETLDDSPQATTNTVDVQDDVEQVKFFTDEEVAAAKSEHDDANVFMVILNETLHSLKTHERRLKTIMEDHRPRFGIHF